MLDQARVIDRLLPGARVVAVGAVALVVGAAFAAGPSPAPATTTPTAPVLAPPAAPPGVVDGKTHALAPVAPADYHAKVVAPHAGKVVVVAFWASYCAPCMEELPGLVALDAARDDVALALVSTDPKEWRGKAQAALAKLKVPTKGVPLWWADAADPQPFIEAVDKSWAGELPFTVVYDAKGRSAVVLSGEQTKAAFEAAVARARAAP